MACLFVSSSETFKELGLMVPESMKKLYKGKKAISYLRPVLSGSSRSATIGGRVWNINGAL